MRTGFVLSATIAAAVLAVPSPAAATLFCPVLKSLDGFVALRKGPGTSHAVVTRMREDDEVQLLEGKQGAWVQVRHWRGDERLDEKTRDAFRTGWVNRRFIGECG